MRKSEHVDEQYWQRIYDNVQRQLLWRFLFIPLMPIGFTEVIALAGKFRDYPFAHAMLLWKKLKP